MKKKHSKSKLAEFITAIRVSQGLSQREWGDKLGVSGAYIAMIETDKIAAPLEFLKRLTTDQRKIAYEMICEQLKKDLEL